MATDTPVPRTLEQLRDAIHRQLDQVIASDAWELTSGAIADLSSGILNLDQVIAANRTHPPGPPPALLKQALEAAWGACPMTTDGDAVVAALRATPLFGGVA